MDPLTMTAAPAAVSGMAHVLHAVHTLVSAVTSAAPAGAPMSDQALALHGLIATLIGFAMSQTNQAFIEHNLATKAWMPQGLKPLLPALISGLVGVLAANFGVSATDAATGAVALTTFTHAVNASPKYASVGKDPDPKVLEAIKAAGKVTSGDPRK